MEQTQPPDPPEPYTAAWWNDFSQRCHFASQCPGLPHGAYRLLEEASEEAEHLAERFVTASAPPSEPSPKARTRPGDELTRQLIKGMAEGVLTWLNKETKP